MKVRIDTYTRDSEAAIEVFGMICAASKKDGVDLRFDPEDKIYNIMGEVDSAALVAIAAIVDAGPFNEDRWELTNDD